MSKLSPLLECFHTTILSGDVTPAVPAIKRNARIAPEKQLAIYIDGYRIRLTQAVRTDYPALLELLGEKPFDRLALDYIEHNPPAHFNLDRYPHAFAAFVRSRHDDNFAADLAMLESAIAEVFMMDDSPPLDPTLCAELTPEEFGSMTLKLRAASRLLRCDYPANDWLDAERAGNTPPPPQPQKMFLYLYRHENNVRRLPLHETAHILLTHLSGGMSVAQAIDASAEAGTGHAETLVTHLQPWFAQWMAEGIFAMPLQS